MKNLTSSNLHMTAMTAAGLLLAVTLTASVTPTPAAAQHACEPDAHRLCSQFIPDEARRRELPAAEHAEPERRLPRRHGRGQGRKKSCQEEKSAAQLIAAQVIAAQVIEAARANALTAIPFYELGT